MQKTKLPELLRELGLENRVALLSLLREKPASASELRRRLTEKRGVAKPYTTVGRYIENLKNLGLVVEKEKRFHLTALGRVLLLSLGDMKNNLGLFEELEGLRHPIDYLPEEFLGGITVLGQARILTDPYSVMLETIKGMENASDTVLIVNSGIASPEYTKLSFEKVVAGLKDMAIIDESWVKRKVEMYRKTAEELGLKGKELEKLKRNLNVKAYDGVYLNIMIVDEDMAGITLPDRGSDDFLTPTFFSEDKEFIAWVRSIFEWYWERSKIIVEW